MYLLVLYFIYKKVLSVVQFPNFMSTEQYFNGIFGAS